MDNNAKRKESIKEIATLAGGCFWCLETIFNELEGVKQVVTGYSGGKVPDPTYKGVSSGTTGHTEAVQIVFYPLVISFEDLLHVFFSVHDPTTLNRQGNDVGPQYRSAVFYHSPTQKATVEKVISEITAEKLWGQPIVTEVREFTGFYPAENYHQHFYDKNPDHPYCRTIIDPKLAKFRKQFTGRLRR